MRDISLVKFLPKEPKVPFISARKVAAVLSVLALIASVFLFTTKGLNYGIDFTGGTVLEIDTGSEPLLEEMRPSVSALGLGSPNLQTIDPPSDKAGGHKYVRVTIPLQPEEPILEHKLEIDVIEAVAREEGENFVILDKQTAADGAVTFDVQIGDERLLSSLRKFEEGEVWDKATDFPVGLRGIGLDNIVITPSASDPDRFSIFVPIKSEGSANVQQLALGLTKVALADVAGDIDIRSQGVVGSKVSGELRQKGIMAIIFAMGAVLMYIWFRFEWQFAAGAVLALFHDVLLTIGMFSLMQLEFNLSIIAAILTIVGYSLNDTVIVYDRIRENLRKYKKMALPSVLNMAINDTLSRTILTSMTTLLALLALYFLGGEGLEGFAFAMIWGVFIGTYSSIFVASPLLLLLNLQRGSNIDREPEPKT